MQELDYKFVNIFDILWHVNIYNQTEKVQELCSRFREGNLLFFLIYLKYWKIKNDFNWIKIKKSRISWLFYYDFEKKILTKYNP